MPEFTEYNNQEFIQGSLFKSFEEQQKELQESKNVRNRVSCFLEDVRKDIFKLTAIKDEFFKYRKKDLSFQEIHSFVLFANEQFLNFIQNYFENNDYFFYLHLIEKYNDFKNDYHQIGKVFLFYLDTFVYEENIEFDLNKEVCSWIENFILADPTNYHEEYYKQILTKIKKRKNGQYYVELVKEFKDISNQEERYEHTELELVELLHSVFVFKKDIKEKAFAYFIESCGMDKKRALYIAMLYLQRFVYSVSESNKIEDFMVVSLENCIAETSDFVLHESKLCAAKSLLYARVNARNTLKNKELIRNILKS